MAIPAGDWEGLIESVEILNLVLPAMYVARFDHSGVGVISSDANISEVSVSGSAIFRTGEFGWVFELRRSMAYGLVILDSFDLAAPYGSTEAWSGCSIPEGTEYDGCPVPADSGWEFPDPPAEVEWEPC